ncbi:asparagine synthase (glutamine-hydrolyzing) [Phycisphaeraceae bacterium D3-23]
MPRMCGIAGILRFDDEPIDPKRAEAMRDALKHRGPDGDGIVHLGRCTLVHTRLAVIDQHDGAQPMSLPDGSLTVVFNGEIYNHAALREQLEKLGHTFTTDHSDTEVLLHGYRQWGTSMMDRLDGMWAFAIWDAEKQELLLSRDRAGQKPLYCGISSRNDEVWFASNNTALGAAYLGGYEKQFANYAHFATDFLRLGYGNAFANFACIDIDKRSWVKWDAKIDLKYFAKGIADFFRTYSDEPVAIPACSGAPQEQLGTTLTDAVSKRLLSDMPLGAFLSAGVDSSLIVAIAQRKINQTGLPPLRTFSVAMEEALYDESVEAAATAEHLGTDHTTLLIQPGDVMDDLETLMRLSGEPTADSSILPTYWLCKAAREHVTVALSGDGGDELFGGYDRYRAMGLLAKRGRLLGMLPATRHREQKSMRARLGRLVHAARQDSPAMQYLSMIQLFDDEQINAMRRSKPDAMDRHEAKGVPAWPDTGDPVRDAMMWDRNHYLPYDILRKVDRASMAVALEVRCPMLSPGMLALSDRLTTEQLRAGGKPKGLLRELAKKYLPPAVAKRRKSGFAIPIGQWFRTTLAEPMRERVLDPGYMDRLDFRPDLPERMCADHLAGTADHTHRLFALLQLSIWHRWLVSQGV